MRKAYNNVSVIADNGKFIGISLGYDYCAEHEWGIAKMKKKLGIDSSKIGVEGRRIHDPSRIKLLTSGNYALLTSRSREDDFEKSLPYSFDFYTKHKESVNLATAWNEDDFAIMTSDPVVKAHLEALYDAAKYNDLALATIRKLPAFENASLSLVVISALPKEALEQLRSADQSAHDLVEYEKKIGLTDLKEKARAASGYKGIHYFLACSPKWINYEDKRHREVRKAEMKTEYDIMYWINYSDDDDNYGWYTVEEIKQWLSTPGLKLTQIRKAK